MVTPGRQDLGASPGEGDPGLARGEPGDDRRLGRLLPRAGQAGHLRRRALLRRLSATTRLRAGMPARRRRGRARRTSPSATPTAPACRSRSADGDRAVVDALREGRSRSGSTPTTTPSAAVANSLAAVREGARLVQGTINGYGERCGNANLVSILPALQLKMGFEVVSPEQLASLTETAHFVDELCNLTPDPDQPYVGRNAFAHKGGMHVAGVAADARTFEHIDPGAVGNEREILPSELSGKATIRSQAEQAGPRDRRGGGRARGRAAEGARAPRLPLRGRAGLLRAAAAARGRGLRAAVRAGGLPGRDREARRRGGARPRRRSRCWSTASAIVRVRRGQRPGQRARPGPARGRSPTATRTWPTSS